MKKACLALVLGSQLLLVAGLWGWGAWHDPLGSPFTADATGRLLAGGRLAGLLATLAVLGQLILISRASWIEPVFGLDRLSRLHHVCGFCTALALLAHAILITLGHAAQTEVGAFQQSRDFWQSYPYVGAAMVGLALLAVIMVLSIRTLRRWLGYEAWYRFHLLLYLALGLAFGHQLAVGSDFAGDEPRQHGFAAYWMALYAVVFGNLLFYRVVRPCWRFWRHRFQVARLVPEADGVISVYLDGRHLERLQAKGGQFLIVRFLAPGFCWEAHPFSLSLPPDGKSLRLTIKPRGDFTRRIATLRPGTPVLVDGPNGIFTASRCQGKKALLVAGGIGITPLRALADDLLAAGRQVVLIYANRHRNAIVFASELEALEKEYSGRFRIIHVLSDDPGWNGEKGIVDGPRIAAWIPEVASYDVFLCGPPPMMAALRQALLRLGIPSSRLHDERFSL